MAATAQYDASGNANAGSLIMTTTSNVNDILRLSAQDQNHTQQLQAHQMMSAGMDAFDHEMNFDGEGLLYVLFLLPRVYA